jgi:hypothetical protein
MANAPLSGRDGRHTLLIWLEKEAAYFRVAGWTGQISLKTFGKSDFSRGGRNVNGALAAHFSL